MKTLVSKTVRQMAEEIIRAVEQASHGLRETGQALAEFVDAFPDGIFDILECEPRLSETFLYNLERVGRGQMDYRLLLDTSPAGQMLRKMPAQIQTKLLNSRGVKVLRLNSQGEPSSSIIHVSSLSAPEAAIALCGSGARSQEDQMMILKKEQARQKCAVLRYTIESDGCVMFLAQTRVSLSELDEILHTAIAKARKALVFKK